MSFSRCGTQALIREKSPKAVYTHCRAHCLNLIIVHSCDQPLIRNMLGTFNEVCNFLALLKFRADAGDEVLANHFSQATN